LFLNGEWLTLLIGALIGYSVGYFFRMRERSITREFEMYQKGMHYLQSLYGFVSCLFDLVDGYIRAVDKGKAQISDLNGFIYLTPKEIVEKYRTNYEEFAKFMGEGKKNGNEVFLRKDLAQDMQDFWGLASYCYEEKEWDKHLSDKFDVVAVEVIDRIEHLLGIRRESLLKGPKWLKPTELRAIIRGAKTVRG